MKKLIKLFLVTFVFLGCTAALADDALLKVINTDFKDKLSIQVAYKTRYGTDYPPTYSPVRTIKLLPGQVVGSGPIDTLFKRGQWAVTDIVHITSIMVQDCPVFYLGGGVLFHPRTVTLIITPIVLNGKVIAANAQMQ